MKRILLSLLALLFLMLLLLSPATSLEGARNGLLLWAYTVLPTLLPFMIGTGMIVSAPYILQCVHFRLYCRFFSTFLNQQASLFSQGYYAVILWVQKWTGIF